jgi:hypothetical protein
MGGEARAADERGLIATIDRDAGAHRVTGHTQWVSQIGQIIRIDSLSIPESTRHFQDRAVQSTRATILGLGTVEEGV